MTIIESFNRYFNLPEFHTYEDLHFAIGSHQCVCIQQGPVFFDEDATYVGPNGQVYKCLGQWMPSRESKPPVGVQWRIER